MKNRSRSFRPWSLFICLFALLSFTGQGHALSDLRIAIYGGLGARSDSILALGRMFAAMGHQPQVIRTFDLTRGRVTTDNFDILVIPDGEEGKVTEYDNNLSDIGSDPYLKSFVQDGGGLLAIGAGAMYISSSCTDCMNWYPGSATQSLTNSTFQSIGNGYAQIQVTDALYGFGLNDLYSIYVPYYAPNISVAAGATKSAQFTMGADSGKAAVIRWTYGLGRVVLFAAEPSVDGQGDLDWTAWDQMESQGYNPQMAWPLVAKALEWLHTGAVSNDTVIDYGSVAGKRVAVYATHTVNGGAYAASLLPLARMIESGGNTPLALRDTEVKNNKLLGANYDGVVFPGGYAYGYKVQLNGYESYVRNFVSGGAGYLGICAGSFYAANSIVWEGEPYDYPLNLYNGQDIGPMNDIIDYPNYTLTPVQFVDTTFGSGTLQQMYYGGGYHTLAAGATNVGKLTYGGEYNNLSAIVRFTYGSGKVFLSTVHPEAEEGSLEDWAYWDGYMNNSDTPLNDPDSEWPYMTNVFNNWLLKSGGAAPNFGGNMIAIAKGSPDTTADSLGDLQRQDKSGTPPSTPGRNNGWYDFKSNNTMDVTGFGINKSGTINSVTLKVKYSTRSGYNGTQYVKWSIDNGATWNNTTIKPTGKQTDVTATYDLKAAGVDTWADIQNLRISFKNTSSSTIGFDYLWVAVP